MASPSRRRNVRLQPPTAQRRPGAGTAPAPEGLPPAGSPELVLLLDEAGAIAVAEPREGPEGPVYKPVIGFRG